MGWFEKQIKQRIDLDQQLFEDSIVRAAGVVLGKKTGAKINDERIVTKKAIDVLLKYYHCKPVDIPKEIKEHEDQLDYCLRPYGLMKRRINLEENWWKDAYGPVLAYSKEYSEPIVILPYKGSGYYYTDRSTGRRVIINKKTAANFKRRAYCFYKPFPQKKLGIYDLLRYMRSCLTSADILFMVICALAAACVGMVIPRLTKAITGYVVSSGNVRMLAGIAVCMLCTAVSTQIITSIGNMLNERVRIKTSLGVDAAMMMRVMSLPTSFFRKYSAGELTNRTTSVSQLCELIVGIFVGTGLTSIASLLYITQIFSFAPDLVIPSVITILITVIFTTGSSLLQIRISKQQLEFSAKESGLSYAMISGIQKIKLAGAEKRFFAKWLNAYSDGAELIYAPPILIKINSVVTLAISLFSNIVLYSLAVKSGIDQSSYYAFASAYGTVMGAFSAFAGTALSIGRIKPVLEMAEPFLKIEPETSENKQTVTKLAGSIELNNVYFRYNEDMPYILENLSLKIRSGEYVAVVGKTGCGKSTLMRLLLGFEKPEKGAVFYDGKDISRLDLPSLRRKIGTVMQNGGLFQGDIFSNIIISAPHLTLDDAWEAAEKAGIADDIRAMPMGMQTIISEGQGGVSGGQKQRLMIARAIAPKPKILIFDEATSALDNKTQKQVSEALDEMGCTRIIIAHRLSTIRHCDRILVLDGGRIIEEGNYETLIKKGGHFAELVEMQRLDISTSSSAD